MIHRSDSCVIDHLLTIRIDFKLVSLDDKPVVMLVARGDTVLVLVVIIHGLADTVDDVASDLDETTSLIQVNSTRKTVVFVDVVAADHRAGHVAQCVDSAPVDQLLHDMMDVVILDTVVLGDRRSVVAIRLIVKR